RRDRDKVLHGRESGIIKRLPHGEFVEVHEPLSQEQLHTLTQHHQYEPLELGPEVDENGVRRKIKRSEKLRALLSKGFYGSDNQIPKPTAEEYQEITSGHGHH
ncbi:ubiquinol-cytochrome c reductase cytochrome b subunit, partial [Streptomyces sp. 8N616]